METETQKQFVIGETNKLSKQTKKDTKYSKISTEDESINSQNSTTEYISVNINPILIEKSSNFFYLKIGHSYSFFGDRNGDPLIIIGPNYIIVIGLLSFITFIFITFFYSFWKYLNLFFKILGILNFLSFLLSYLYTVLINPGYPKHDLESKTGEPRDKFRWCGACKIYVSIEKKTNQFKEKNVINILPFFIFLYFIIYYILQLLGLLVNNKLYERYLTLICTIFKEGGKFLVILLLIMIFYIFNKYVIGANPSFNNIPVGNNKVTVYKDEESQEIN